MLNINQQIEVQFTIYLALLFFVSYNYIWRWSMVIKTIIGFISAIALLSSVGIGLLATPGTVEYSIGAAEFGNDSVNISNDGYRLSLNYGGNFPAYAGLHITDGITITDIYYTWMDISDYNCTVDLLKNRLNGTTETITTFSTVNESDEIITSHIFTSIVIDNTYPYYFSFYCPSMPSGEAWLYAIRLEYTYPSFLSMISR
jgi:hypothetical protein